MHCKTMSIGDKVYYRGRFGIIDMFEGDRLFLSDEDTGSSASNILKDDCITEYSYWYGSALSASGIQY